MSGRGRSKRVAGGAGDAVRVLALFAAGMVWANAVTLRKVAAALPLAATDPSTERRLQRFLTNPGVDVATLWQPLLPVLLRTWASGSWSSSSTRPPIATTPRSWCWGWWCASACCRWPGG